MLSKPWLNADSDSVRVGLDLGTSGLKAVALNHAGDVIARASVAYPTSRPEVGAAEQDCAHWLDAVRVAIDQVALVVPSSKWQGIGLSAMLPTLVCLDDNGNPVGPAVTWQDSRAESWGDELREGIADLYERTGQWVDGRYLLSMWMRLRSVDDFDAQRVTALAGAKDYLVQWLTGELVTDPSTAAGFGCYGLAEDSWLDDVLTAADCSLRLPTVAASTTTLSLQASAANILGLPEGLPIAVGAADSVLGALGMRAASPGDIAYVAGSSTVILGVSEQRPIDPQHRFIVTPMAQPGTWGLEMDLMATGTAISWLAGLLGYDSAEDAMQDARNADSDHAPQFLPYVSPGEQGALWDPHLTGVITGLHLGHERSHLVRGLVDGIVLESLRCIEVLREYGCVGDVLRVAGGSALDPWFRQLLANATGADVVAPVDGDSDYSAIGAALLLGGSVGESQTSIHHADEDAQMWKARLSALDLVRHAVASARIP